MSDMNLRAAFKNTFLLMNKQTDQNNRKISVCFENNLLAFSCPIKAAKVAHFDGAAHGVAINGSLVGHRHITPGSAPEDGPFDLITFNCSFSGYFVTLSSFHSDRNLFSILLKMNGAGPLSSLSHHRHFPGARHIRIPGACEAN